MSWRACNTEDDWPYVTAALTKLEQYAKAYDWAVEVDFLEAVGNIYDAIVSGQGYVIDGYLVMIDSIKPWYSKSEVLTEWLVLKLYDGGSVDSIPPVLVELAKKYNVAVIMTADSSPVSIVAGAYQRAGFNKLTTSFYKVVP